MEKNFYLYKINRKLGFVSDLSSALSKKPNLLI